MSTDRRVSPDGFIHLDDCAVWQGQPCSCGAVGPHEGYAASEAREGIELPADGISRTVLLDGISVTASVRVIASTDQEASSSG